LKEADRPQLTTRRMRIAWRVSKAADTHSEYVIVIAFPLNNGYVNAPQCYVYTILLVFINIVLV
jgi:hypothetical protein